MQKKKSSLTAENICSSIVDRASAEPRIWTLDFQKGSAASEEKISLEPDLDML